MADYTTSLSALLDRAVDAIRDDIAKEGLVALKSSLDSAGFGKYEGLKNYEVFAHVSGDEIVFEIQVEFDSLDEDTQKQVKEQAKEEAKQRADDMELIRKTAKSYATSGVGGMTRRIVGRRNAKNPAADARKKIHDARRPAHEVQEATKGSDERLAEHEFSLRAPRGMSITKTGKLSVVMQKTVQETERGFRMPQGDFQGILGDFMKRLEKVIVQNFAPELEKILARSI